MNSKLSYRLKADLVNENFVVCSDEFEVTDNLMYKLHKNSVLVELGYLYNFLDYDEYISRMEQINYAYERVTEKYDSLNDKLKEYINRCNSEHMHEQLKSEIIEYSNPIRMHLLTHGEINCLELDNKLSQIVKVMQPYRDKENKDKIINSRIDEMLEMVEPLKLIMKKFFFANNIIDKSSLKDLLFVENNITIDMNVLDKIIDSLDCFKGNYQVAFNEILCSKNIIDSKSIIGNFAYSMYKEDPYIFISGENIFNEKMMIVHEVSHVALSKNLSRNNEFTSIFVDSTLDETLSIINEYYTAFKYLEYDKEGVNIIMNRVLVSILLDSIIVSYSRKLKDNNKLYDHEFFAEYEDMFGRIFGSSIVCDNIAVSYFWGKIPLIGTDEITKYWLGNVLGFLIAFELNINPGKAELYSAILNSTRIAQMDVFDLIEELEINLSYSNLINYLQRFYTRFE